MPYDPNAMAQARQALAANFVPWGRLPPPPPELELLPDALLLKQRARALRTVATDEELPPQGPRPSLRDLGTGNRRIIALSAQLPGVGTAARTSNTFPWPIIIRRVSTSLRMTYDTGNRFNLVWGTSPSISGQTFSNIVGKLLDDESQDGFILQAASTDAGASWDIAPNIAVTESGMRLMVGLRNAVAAAADYLMTITVEELNPDAYSALLVPDVPPLLTYTRAITTPGPPAPRVPTQATTPRGVWVKVLSGGGVLARRAVAWEDLAPELKAEWRSAQLSGRPLPTMEPIW